MNKFEISLLGLVLVSAIRTGFVINVAFREGLSSVSIIDAAMAIALLGVLITGGLKLLKK